MDKRLAALIVIVVVVALGGAGWYLAGRNTATPASSASSTSSSGSMSGAADKSSGSTINQPVDTTVTIQNMAFTPDSMVVHTGTTITWKNADSVAHTVVETDGKQGPDSSSIAPGSSYSFTFTAAGTYHYHCSIHPSMTGTITVTAAQ